MRNVAVLVLSLSSFGCAAVFRGTKDHVVVESTPPGVEVTYGSRPVGVTPAKFDAERSGVTQLTLRKDGYEDHHGIVKKEMNAAWVALDILTCIPLLCVPLLVDAVTGAWYDVEERYVAKMRPGTSTASVVAAAGPHGTPPTPSTPTTAPGPSASTLPTLSESDRKATARAAYAEGLALQEKGRCPEAISRLEVAQKFFDAPTHLLHIAQCQSATGRLVEAAETYELLVRPTLAKDSPEAFRDAQDTGKKELMQLRPRIPTLRIQTIPSSSGLSSLIVKVNGSSIPNEVLGIARPVNPAHYKVTAWAAGYKEATSEIDVGEATSKMVELKLPR